MLRVGEVVSIDPQKATAKVRFFDMDEEVSHELPIKFPRTGKDRVYWMPKVGDTVICQMLNQTDGFVVGEYYHSQNPPPESDPEKVILTFEDGTRIEYDKSTGKLTIENPKEITLKVQNSITKETQTLQISTQNLSISAGSSSNLSTPTFTISGNVMIQGTLIVAGGIQSVGSLIAQGGVMTSPSGMAVFMDDLVNKFNTHTHTDSQGGSTSVPDKQLP